MDQAAFSLYQAAIQVAEDEFARGAFRAAFERYADLLASRLRATLETGAALENTADILVGDRLAQLALLLGRIDAADALLDGIAGIARGASNGYLCDYTTLQRVHLALAGGRPGSAQALLRSMSSSIGDIAQLTFSDAGVAIWESQYGWAMMAPGPRAVLLGSFYLACGQLNAALGRYGQARAGLVRGLVYCGAAAPDLAQRMALPLQLTNVAAMLEQGDLATARALLAAVEAQIDPVRAPAYRVQWLELRGKLDLLAGDYGTALRALEGVLEIAHAGQFDRAQLQAQVNLAHVLTVLNQTAAAAVMLERARVAAQALRDQATAMRIGVLIKLGQARGQSLAPATSIMPSVNEMWEGPLDQPAAPAADDLDPELLPQEGNFLALFEVRALIVHWHLGHGRVATARAALERVARTFGHTDSRLIALRLQVLEGMLDYYSSAWDLAVRHLNAARLGATALGLKGELRQILRILVWARARQGAPAAPLRELADQADQLLQAQGATLDGAQRALFLLNKWTADEEALVRQVEDLRELKKRAAGARWPHRLRLQWEILRKLNRLMWQIDRHKALVAMRTLTPGASPPAASDAPSLARRLRSPGFRSATLAFLVLPDRTVTIRASGLALDFAVAAVTRLRLRQIVKDWYETQSGNGEPLVQALELDAALRGLPARVKSLRIVPDDILHGVPFAALVHEGGYWVERYALSIDFESVAPVRPRAAAATRPLLLAGVSRACGQFPPLPGVPRELEAVSGVLAARSAPLLDANVSRAAMLALLPQAALGHIACHGVFAPDQPDTSGLVLMPVPGQVEILSLRDLAQLDLRALRHMTLSSCWGADSFVAPGRWLISLPETLVRAGSGSVLASLWPVADRAAQAFMAQFYLNLKTQRRDRALQLAQLGRMRPATAGATAPSPWDWSGFVLYGNAGPLAIPH